MNLKDDIKQKEIITIAGSVFCFLLSFLLIRNSGISIDYITSFQSQLMKFIMIGSADMTLEASLFVFIASFLGMFTAFIPFTAGFAFLSSYGFLNNKRFIGLAASLVSSVFMLILFGFSILSIFLVIAMIISCTFIIPLANTYGKELKRWVLFRTGSHSISTALMIINIFAGIGVFLAVSANMGYYAESIKADFSSTMEEVTLAEFSSLGELTEEQQMLLNDQIKQRTEEFFADSLLIRSLIKFLPVTTAFSAWAFLELLRMLLIPNIGGIMTYLMIRFERRK